MENINRVYIAIDLKSFYASVLPCEEFCGFIQVIIAEDAAGQGIQQLRAQPEDLPCTAIGDQETGQHVVHAGGGRGGQKNGPAAGRAFQQDHGIRGVAFAPGRQIVRGGSQIAIMAITYARTLVHEAFQGRGRGRGQAQAGSYAEGKDFSPVEAQQVVTEPPGCTGHETGDQRAFPGAVVAAEKQGAPMQAHGRGMEGDQAGAGMTAGGHCIFYTRRLPCR